MLVRVHLLEMINFSKFYDKGVHIAYSITLNRDLRSCILLYTVCSNTLFVYK